MSIEIIPLQSLTLTDSSGLTRVASWVPLCAKMGDTWRLRLWNQIFSSSGLTSGGWSSSHVMTIGSWITVPLRRALRRTIGRSSSPTAIL